jgi:hypothetical protein
VAEEGLMTQEEQEMRVVGARKPLAHLVITKKEICKVRGTTRKSRKYD